VDVGLSVLVDAILHVMTNALALVALDVKVDVVVMQE